MTCEMRVTPALEITGSEPDVLIWSPVFSFEPWLRGQVDSAGDSLFLTLVLALLQSSVPWPTFSRRIQ